MRNRYLEKISSFEDLGTIPMDKAAGLVNSVKTFARNVSGKGIREARANLKYYSHAKKKWSPGSTSPATNLKGQYQEQLLKQKDITRKARIQALAGVAGLGAVASLASRKKELEQQERIIYV
jgi:hypothetical protein